MIEALQIETEPGFTKANSANIPKVRSEAIAQLLKRLPNSSPLNGNKDEYCVDYVQVRRTSSVFEARGVVFPVAPIDNILPFIRVSMKINRKDDAIIEVGCENCNDRGLCVHLMTFIFWLHRKSGEPPGSTMFNYWGSEAESVMNLEAPEPQRIRDLFTCDDLRLECDMEASLANAEEESAVLQAVLDEIESMDLRDIAFYQHSRFIVDEFEPVFIHHTLLDSATNFVTDPPSFLQYMDELSKQGVFDRLSEVSRNSYKSTLWLETQYMRLRCSLIHSIAARKDERDDKQLMTALFGRDRCENLEERRQMKQHKRFILKQTEKLENKTYHECGVIISDSYPYICASPDGITDDHIVEIKAPKTEEEFEKYLEGRETIAPKYMAQIQIQMYVANVTKALYCVLSPTFDTNGALHYVWVQADMEFVASLLGAAEDFWKDVVFPHLTKVYSLDQ